MGSARAAVLMIFGLLGLILYEGGRPSGPEIVQPWTEQGPSSVRRRGTRPTSLTNWSSACSRMLATVYARPGPARKARSAGACSARRTRANRNPLPMGRGSPADRGATPRMGGLPRAPRALVLYGMSRGLPARGGGGRQRPRGHLGGAPASPAQGERAEGRSAESEREDLGKANTQMEAARLELREVELRHGLDSPEGAPRRSGMTARWPMLRRSSIESMSRFGPRTSE